VHADVTVRDASAQQRRGETRQFADDHYNGDTAQFGDARQFDDA
jgi:hypothetical protein